MQKKHGKRTILFLALIGIALLVVLLSLLKDRGLFDKPSGEPAALTGFGLYSPVEIDGSVYFPSVSDGALSYELASRAQLPKGETSLMSKNGTIALPDDFLEELYREFGDVTYSSASFHSYDAQYLLVTPEGGALSVCGVILRHNEQFYLGNFDCELTDALLSQLVSALATLGEE